jgi:myo-inositol-1(or 4)-monophosphatase
MLRMSRSKTRERDLHRIADALAAAAGVLRLHAASDFAVEYKSHDSPVTAADREVDALLRAMLAEPEAGWLSEETADDLVRLQRQRVWIVDPLDGTKEFTMRLPEWSVSIGLVENGVPVAGGICNPLTGETVIGSLETGVRLNGEPVRPRPCARIEDAVVLASRSEVTRGEWQRFAPLGCEIRTLGSVAYKLALVAAGLADATWTYVPKSEWDVAAGSALVRAAGGTVTLLDGSAPAFNQRKPRYGGLLAFSAAAAALFPPRLAQLGG